MRTKATIVALAVTGLMMMASIASAGAFVVQPVNATATSQGDPSWSGPWAAYDGSGLDTAWTTVTTGKPIPNPWPGHSSGWDGSHYQSEYGGASPTLTFDLGETYALTGMHFWNGSPHDLTNCGVRTANVSVSTDGASYTPVSLGGLDTNGTFFQAISSWSSADHTGVDYTFSVAARYVRLDVTSNWGGPYTAISEVRFVAVSAPHAGDANNDGAVDVVDLGILATNYDKTVLPHGSSQSWALADFNDDGNVDVVDLGVLATNYDWAGAPAGNIPEPMILSLLAMGSLALLRRGGRGR